MPENSGAEPESRAATLMQEAERYRKNGLRSWIIHEVAAAACILVAAVALVTIRDWTIATAAVVLSTAIDAKAHAAQARWNNRALELRLAAIIQDAAERDREIVSAINAIHDKLGAR